MFLESSLHAESPAPASAQPAPPAILNLGFIVIMVVFAYFMLIRPQVKSQKERQEVLKKLKEGDKVVLASGVYATVVKVDEAEDILTLKIAENVNVKAQRSAVDRLQK